MIIFVVISPFIQDNFDFYTHSFYSMFWQENIKEEEFTIPENIVNISLQIKSKILPIDHGELLKNAFCKHVDCTLPNLAIYDISVADGNGWEQDKKGYFYPSNRTKLTIRCRKEYASAIEKLVDTTLDLGEFSIQLVKLKAENILSDSSILFSKMLISPEKEENDFLQTCFNELQQLNINPKKMMAGLSREIKLDGEICNTRSLMIADLSKQESVTLQENGIGTYQLLGCGIFVPQKGIDSVDAV